MRVRHILEVCLTSSLFCQSVSQSVFFIFVFRPTFWYFFVLSSDDLIWRNLERREWRMEEGSTLRQQRQKDDERHEVTLRNVQRNICVSFGFFAYQSCVLCLQEYLSKGRFLFTVTVWHGIMVRKGNKRKGENENPILVISLSHTHSITTQYTQVTQP